MGQVNSGLECQSPQRRWLGDGLQIGWFEFEKRALLMLGSTCRMSSVSDGKASESRK